MDKGYIKSTNNYLIPYVSEITGNENLVVVISHGFGSSKASPTAQMMLHRLSAIGIGAVAYDFPAHGDSTAAGDFLRIRNCIDDLDAVRSFAAESAPDADISYFSSSFGAYISLQYLSESEFRNARVFCRSAAVNMPALFAHPTPQEVKNFDEFGFNIVDHGYSRPLKITTDFISDLEERDLFHIYRPGCADIKMIHGEKDEVINIKYAEQFAELSGAELTIVPEGDHQLSGPGMPEQAASEALDFFLRRP